MLYFFIMINLFNLKIIKSKFIKEKLNLFYNLFNLICKDLDFFSFLNAMHKIDNKSNIY